MNKRIIQATAEAIGTAEDTKKAIGMAVIMDQQKARGLEEYSKRMEADKQKNDEDIIVTAEDIIGEMNRGIINGPKVENVERDER